METKHVEGAPDTGVSGGDESPEQKVIHKTIRDAVSVCVANVNFPGIESIEVSYFDISPSELQVVVSHLATLGLSELSVSADVNLYVRISNSDVVHSRQALPFRIHITNQSGDVHATAINQTDWEVGWERALAPLKHAAIESMKSDIEQVYPGSSEGTSEFQAAMVLLASEMIGPYPGRIATFLGYPKQLLDVIGARLYEAGVWEEHEVRCERWFDPGRGHIAMVMDVMVALGRLTRRWSERDKQFRYYLAEGNDVSKFSV